MSCFSLGVAVGLAAMSVASVAQASEPPARPPLQWNPEWPRFRTLEYVASGAFIALGIGSLFLEPTAGAWSQRNGFDEAFRDTFRLRSASDRSTTRAISDVLLFGTLSFPFIVDVVAVAGLGHGNTDVARQLTFMNVETLAVSIGLQTFISGLASRERPYGRSCGTEDSPPDGFCEGKRRYLSFYSGHATAVFTVAGLTCAHHQNLPLYGGGVADGFACGAVVAAAFATATFRITSDEHHASDILLGSGLGFLAGYGLPTFLHYNVPGRGKKSRTSMTLGGGPAPIGLSLMGTLD